MMNNISQLDALRSATNRAQVAQILGIKHQLLTHILYKKGKEGQNYKKFQIPKKKGGTREINAPTEGLKDLQRKLANLITECLNEISVALDTPNTVSHGFMEGRSIFTNAFPHKNKRYVFNIDLKDFFGTITFQRLRGFLISDSSFELNKDVATVLAQIACHEGKLPQGSPSSPIMSNLIGQILDMHLVKLAAQNGCSYTRYADDITFSTNKRDFPSPIAKKLEISESWIPGRQLAGLVKKCGFEINSDKTRMQYRDSRQEVTGLVTNRRLNVKAEYRHDVRAKVFTLLNTGTYFNKISKIDENGVQSLSEEPGSINQLHGRLGFIYSLDSFHLLRTEEHSYNFFASKQQLDQYTNKNKSKEKESSKFKSKKDVGNKKTRESMYYRFLLYKILYANTKPLLICEGKTDVVYLSKAMHSLCENFPSLTAVGAEGKKKLTFQLFKFADTSTGSILRIKNGGAGSLSNLIESYLEESTRFQAPKPKHPVIFIVDNDAAVKDKGALYDKIEKITKTKPTGNESFIFISENIYLVATPLNGKVESCIEDLFTQEDKEIPVDGKTFDVNVKKDTDKLYGKATFAYKVVEKFNLNFEGFVPFVQNIVSAIEDFYQPPSKAVGNADDFGISGDLQ